ncbi:transcription termination factor Rho [Hoyosella rhizosphaerae]|uniref:transcription termination factor Rho n=1 Tax=Hoyosella rhizosphaerae TaxID=1755582 RepID=UPI00227C550F|nr:transcription termination factor Rho [Hoyosella rhizosphaerae]
MVLAELRALAGNLGIRGTSGMRKSDLISAIEERQRANAAHSQTQKNTEKPSSEASKAEAKTEAAPKVEAANEADAPQNQRARRRATSRQGDAPKQSDGATVAAQAENGDGEADNRRSPARAKNESGAEPAVTTASGEASNESARKDSSAQSEKQNDRSGQQDQRTRSNSGQDNNRDDNEGSPRRRQRGQDGSGRRDGDQGQRNSNRDQGNRDQGGRDQGNRDQGGRDQGGRDQSNRDQSNRDQGNRDQGNRDQGPRDQGNRDGDDDGDGRGRRGRRFRERRRTRNDRPNDSNEAEIREDDVLQPVAGILDVLDNYAFVRTSGYLAGPNDVYVSMNMVRKNGLRRGDAITGAVRLPKEGEQGSQRQKFNPLVRLDTINGTAPDQARKRADFSKLTPLYPNERLRLETAPNILTTRIIDLIMPIGKGQRALIVSPPKAGKTTVLQDIANAIAVNNPECYLMVVLVDERPEEVTDMQRSVKGEVISSTFDRPPSDHTSVAELAIERAKRLVEIGKDVVVLLDSITRLGRAYNNSSPASGRILSGGVDSTALFPPKRFLGAARNIENGGSLTIIATAMVETGSQGDTVIYEEFKGTGNAELKLDRRIAERRVFPAVDVIPSGTRRDDLLLGPDEFAVLHKLRRVLSGLDAHQAIDLLVDRLRKTKSNVEFLMQVQKTTPGMMNDD